MNNWMQKVLIVGVAGASTILAACGGGGGSNPGVTGDVNGTGATAKVFVRGAITGFGSVIVEGKRFDTNDAQVEIDDMPSATEDALRVGQIVEVRGRRDDDGNFQADRIRYDAEIRGPIASIDLEAQTLMVAGQQIRIVGATAFESGDLSSLAVDDSVEVSGQIDGEGRLVASYVERESEGRNEIEVTGRLAALDSAQRRFRVQSLDIDFGNANVAPPGVTLANGQLVEVEGTLSGTLLTASRVEIEDAPSVSGDDDFDDGTEVEIDGVIASLDVAAQSFMLRGTLVRYGSTTRFEEGRSEDLADGVLVEVEGIFGADGFIEADEIDFEEGRNADPGSERIEIEGDVQAVNVEAGTLQLLRTTILTNARTRFEDDRDDLRTFGLSDLQPGDAVEVAAVRTEQGVVAIRIEREDLDDDDNNDDDGDNARELKGALERKDAVNRELVVSGIVIDASNARFEDDDVDVSADTFFTAVAVGDFIEAEGRFDENLQRFIAIEVEREREDDDGDSVDDSDDGSSDDGETDDIDDNDEGDLGGDSESDD